MMTNKELQEKYDQMHHEGQTAWFSDGEEERLAIYQMGRPWKGKTVLEIGCGEGHLASMIAAGGGHVSGIDYSDTAIEKAMQLYDRPVFASVHYKDYSGLYNTLIMQGVLEHLDKPFEELKWMKDNLLDPSKGTIITSSPCFINPRGYVWMVLATMLGAPMSLTDLHFLHPWQFKEFAEKENMLLHFDTCDMSWGNGPAMIEDFKKRLPLAMKDLGRKLNFNIPYRTTELLDFLENSYKLLNWQESVGATAIYRFSPKN